MKKLITQSFYQWLMPCLLVIGFQQQMKAQAPTIVFINGTADVVGAIQFTLGDGSSVGEVLSPFTVFFEAGITDPNGSPFTYEWDFGDSIKSTLSTPTHTFNVLTLNTTKTFTIKLTVTNIRGLSSSVSTSLSVKTPPYAVGCLKATYFPNISLSGLPTATRAETVIDFRTFAESSVRWEGTAIPPVSGAYTFTVTVDDGARLWVNNQLVIDKWLDVASATTYTATVNLTQGQAIPIKLENYHRLSTGGIAQLFWTIPNQTSTLLPFSACAITIPPIDSTKCFRIVNKVSNKSLEIKDASTAEGATIFQWATVEGKANQLWQLRRLTDGNYTFTSKSSGKLIDAPDCTEGGIIKQYAADGTNSQRWALELQADISYKIRNASCNKYLRLESGSTADGASVGIKNDFGTDAFKWLIQEATCTAPIDPSVCYRIVNKATNKVLEIKDASLTDSTQIYQWASATNRPQQLWKTTLLSDGKYSIKSVSSGKVMDILDNTAAGFCVEGTIIQQFPYDGTNSQRWGLIAQTDGSYKILNTTCNKYLRVESASTADGASVGIKNDFGTDAFKWYFQAADCTTGAVLSATNATFGFEARASEGRAKLQWVTNTGDKTDYFTVERLNPQGSFDVLDRQNAFATNDTKYYTFTDNDLLEGDNLYRINTVFNNAPPQYSEVKKISFSKTDGVNIFPNPADEFINVDLRKYEGKTVALSVYNSVGLLVKKQTIEKVSVAPQQIDIQGFDAGSYLLRVQSEGKREVTRLFHIAK
jgi:hypothetical protein